MHLILVCVAEYKISQLNNLQYLSCSINDVVICDSELVIEGQPIGFGFNCRTNLYGLFPVNKFFIFDSTNSIKGDLVKVFKNHQSNSGLSPGENTPGIFHRTTKKSIGAATLCALCGEYMIGLRLEFVHCILCNQVFHGLCWKNHISYKKCYRFVKITNQRLISSFKSIEMDISEWSKEQVLQWLCTVNCSRLFDIFEMKDVNGQILLTMMAENENLIINEASKTKHVWPLISDKFHRESLHVAISELLRPATSNDTVMRTSANADVSFGHNAINTSDRDKYIIECGGHYLREVTYLSMTSCYYCYGTLLGIHKQGLHCVKCRLDFHKMCAAQINITQCSGPIVDEQPDYLDSSVFGVPLESQVNDKNKVPLFLNCCIKRLEARQTVNNSGLKLLELYSQTADTKDLMTLRTTFAHPIYDNAGELTGLSDISDSLVTNLVKLFLKELPEPVLTYGLYNSIVEKIKIDQNDRLNCFDLHSILTLLPAVNRSTLVLLVKHFEYACQESANDLGNVTQMANKWSKIFSKTLIWPPHIMMCDLGSLQIKNQKIIQLIFEYKLVTFDSFVWPIVECEYVDNYDDESCKSPSTPSRPVTEIIDTNLDINSQDWYWSDTTKEEVNDFMSGLPDESFLVRDSSNKTLGEYTLTVRKDGENKLIRIVNNNGFYGFQDPNRFRSVAELIKYYQTNKLSEYNEQLNLYLRYPVSKTKSEVFGHSNDCYVLSDEELIDLLKKTMKEYMDLNAKVERNCCEHEACQKELDEVTKTIKGVDLVQTWCKNHTEHIMNAMYTKPVMRDHSSKSLQILNKKLNHCAQVIKSSNELRNSLTATSTMLINSLSVDRPNLKKLNRRQQQCIRQLKERGVPNEMFDTDNLKLDELCEQIKDSLNHNNPINDQSTWYIEDLTRPEATARLVGKRHGTFLVRKSKEKNSYALDIVVNNSVQHCLIYCCNAMYGFVKNECLYQSLSDLVKTFHLRSLDQYNAELRTKLSYPVNCSSAT